MFNVCICLWYFNRNSLSDRLTIQIQASDSLQNNTPDAQPYKSIKRPCPVYSGGHINIHIPHNWKLCRHMGTCLHLNINAVLISFSAFSNSSKTITPNRTHVTLSIEIILLDTAFVCPNDPAPSTLSLLSKPAVLKISTSCQWLLGLQKKFSLCKRKSWGHVPTLYAKEKQK